MNRKRNYKIMEKTVDAKVFKIVGGVYQIIEKLGAGSFGEIYKGRNITNNEEVALKLVYITIILRFRNQV